MYFVAAVLNLSLLSTVILEMWKAFAIHRVRLTEECAVFRTKEDSTHTVLAAEGT